MTTIALQRPIMLWDKLTRLLFWQPSFEESHTDRAIRLAREKEEWDNNPEKEKVEELLRQFQELSWAGKAKVRKHITRGL